MVVSLREELIETRAELQRALTRIAELEARLAANSGNSSRPPSSDGLAKAAPKPRSLRKKTDRKPGGRHGHDGTTLRQVAKPQHEIAHEPGPCTGCGCPLSGRPITAVERRQQFDLPPICIEVTGHQPVERECVCGQRTRAQAPAGVDAPVQYGPRIAAIVVYLHVGQFRSKKRTAQALAQLFGTPLSGGTVASLTERAAGGLDGFLAHVRDKLTGCEVVGFDETGLRVAGKLHWVHCGELQAVCDGVPAGEWCWATQAADALVAMQTLVGDAIDAHHDVEETALTDQIHHYRSAALIGINQTAARSDKLMKKRNALAQRLINRQNDYLRFTHDWRVVPDNNGSERDIRMIKLRQKVSGGLRTLTGAKHFCAIRSYLSPAAKHGMQFFDALVMLADGHPCIPATA